MPSIGILSNDFAWYGHPKIKHSVKCRYLRSIFFKDGQGIYRVNLLGTYYIDILNFFLSVLWKINQKKFFFIFKLFFSVKYCLLLFTQLRWLFCISMRLFRLTIFL